MRRGLLAVFCTILWVGPADAQTCLGNFSFSDAPLQISGGAEFSSHTHTFGGFVTKGNDQYFVRGGGVIGGVSDIDGMFKGLIVSGGTERTMGADKKYFVCPTASLLMAWGADPAPDLSASRTILSLGGSVGWEASTSGTRRIVPTVGGAFNSSRSSLSGFGSFTDSFGSIQGGVGFFLDDKKVLTPSITIPFGLDETEVVFTVIFTMKWDR